MIGLSSCSHRFPPFPFPLAWRLTLQLNHSLAKAMSSSTSAASNLSVKNLLGIGAGIGIGLILIVSVFDQTVGAVMAVTLALTYMTFYITRNPTEEQTHCKCRGFFFLRLTLTFPLYYSPIS